MSQTESSSALLPGGGPPDQDPLAHGKMWSPEEALRRAPRSAEEWLAMLEGDGSPWPREEDEPREEIAEEDVTIMPSKEVQRRHIEERR